MRDPLSRLKQLPWRSLIQAALLAVLLLEVPIIWLLSLEAFHLLSNSVVGILVNLGILIGIGAIAVWFLERIDRASIQTGSLWALVFCLELIRIPVYLLLGAISFSLTSLALTAVGVFWAGRRYWQSFKRW